MTDAGSGLGRSSLAAVRAAHAAGYVAAVARSAPDSLAARSRWCVRIVDVPPPDDAVAFREAIDAEVAQHGHRRVFPASDAALLALGAPVEHLLRKDALMRRADAAGFAVPPTQTHETHADLREASALFDYPVIVKPLVSTAPARVCVDRADVDRLPDIGATVSQPLIVGELRAVALAIKGGRAVAAVEQVASRTWPPRSGTSCFATTVPVDEDRVRQLVALAAPYEGILQVQLVGDHLIDANPRVYGSLPLAVAAGANLVAADLDGAADESVRARAGVHYRWIEGDVRHAMHAARHRPGDIVNIARTLLPRRGTAHSVESVVDPMPLLARAAFAMRR